MPAYWTPIRTDVTDALLDSDNGQLPRQDYTG